MTVSACTKFGLCLSWLYGGFLPSSVVRIAHLSPVACPPPSVCPGTNLTLARDVSDRQLVDQLHQRLSASRPHLPHDPISVAPVDGPPPEMVTVLRVVTGSSEESASQPERRPRSADGPALATLVSARWPQMVRVPKPDTAKEDRETAARHATARKAVHAAMYVCCLVPPVCVAGAPAQKLPECGHEKPYVRHRP